MDLYLHGGPGGTASVERAWFSDSSAGPRPDLFWWDQPTPAEYSVAPFAELVDAAEAQLRKLSARGPAGIVATSFGGQIALELANRVPQLIRQITLLGTSFYPAAGFSRLAEKMIEVGMGDARLQNVLAAALRKLDASTFWPLLTEMMAAGDFFPLYWRSPELRDRYRSLSGGGLAIDQATFTRLINDRLAPPELRPSQLPLETPVKIFFGEFDPLLRDLSVESAQWRTVFSQADIQRIPTGHFVAFEWPAEKW